MGPECEQRLVEHVQARRDPEAFRELYDLYLPRVHTYVSYRAIASNDLLPEDALLRRDAFLRLRELVNTLPARKREVVSLLY